MSNPDPLAFSLYVSYSQVGVFGAGLQNPFNDWTQAHVDQGFAWRPESVSFRCLCETGTMAVSVAVKSDFVLRIDTIRAIQVPFAAPAGGQLEIASITDGAHVKVDPGSYLLIFETGINPAGDAWCEFSFVPSKESLFAILRADPELHPRRDLVLTAEPA